MDRREKEALKAKIYEKYVEEGIGSALNLANTYSIITYRFCPPCAADMPVIFGDIDCIICEQETHHIKNDDFIPENKEP